MNKFSRILFLLINFILLINVNYINAQDFKAERIWKLADRKKSIYFEKGIFHFINDSKSQARNSIIGVRNSFVSSRGYERPVFDFTGVIPSSIYGNINQDSNLLSIDFINSSLATIPESLKSSPNLLDLKFYDFNDNRMSVEIKFKPDVSFDIFILENPGRLVVDIKKN